MKLSYIIRLLLILTLGSMCILSSTLARYSDEYSGNDTALVAKWNFRVGTSEDNLHNLGFTFDVFGGEALKPQAKGENTFYLSGGESDVAIDYEVFMNVKVLQIDIDENNGDDDDFPPLIFLIESESETAEASIEEPYDDWFDLQNIEADEDGYFLIAKGHMEHSSAELIPITIRWWWNTSYYVGDNPNPDVSEEGDYYAKALVIWQGLVNQYNARVSEANAFWPDHPQVVTTVDEVEVVSYDCTVKPCPYGESDSAHKDAYQVLRDAVDDAEDAIDNSWKVKYDNYDTKALSALSNLDESSPQSILIKVTGDQVAPAEL
jgi:hypothetical protein